MNDKQKSDEQIEAIAIYLAEDLANVRLYKVDEVSAKIKAALNILIHHKFKNEFIEGLKNKSLRLSYVTKRNQLEINFWKQKAKNKMTELEINSSFDEIDTLLKNEKLK